MQMNYELEMQPANVGGLGDAMFKTTDSYLAEEAICPGMAVALGTNPAKQVKELAEGAQFAGIAMHAHKELVHPYYPEGYCVPVVTEGRVWVKVEGDVVAGKPACYDPAKKAWVAEGGIQLSCAAYRTNTISGMAMVEIF